MRNTVVDGAVGGKQSTAAGEKMQRLDSGLLPVLGMNVSAQQHLNVNTTVNKTASGLIYGRLQGVLEPG